MVDAVDVGASPGKPRLDLAVSMTESMEGLTGLSLTGDILLAVSYALEIVMVVGLLRASNEALRSLKLGVRADIRSQPAVDTTMGIVFGEVGVYGARREPRLLPALFAKLVVLSGAAASG